MRIEREKPGRSPESVWDYPRPPVVQPTDRHVEVIFCGKTIADSTRAVRVLERSHPPVYYVPLDDVRPGVLEPSGRATYCEFKGEACYYSVTCAGTTTEDAAWIYESPEPGYEDLAGHVAFYPAKMDECRLDGEVVRAQPGEYYGGWITSDVTGPFKGEPGTRDW